MKKPPKWAQRHAERVVKALGCNAWTVKIEPTDQPNPANPDADATCYANPETLSATIKVRPWCLKRDCPSARALLTHELIHTAFSLHDRVVWDLITGFVPKGRQREAAVCLIRVANEQCVERMARGLTEALGE